MRCDAKECNNETSEDFIKLGEKNIHRECMTDFMWLQKTGELWLKFYNPKESWNVMIRSLEKLNESHLAEYICFALSKAIRNKEKLSSFHSLYYVVNNLNYINAYKNKDKKLDNVVFDMVYFSKEEYAELQQFMGYNQIKLEYYIKRLNQYIKDTGKVYNSHYKTLMDWYNKDELRKPVPYKSTII